MVDALSPSQIRGARAMLDWSMVDLSRAARVSVSTIKRIESGGKWAGSDRTVDMIQGALEAEGVQFLPDDGWGPGMRHRKRRSATLALAS